MNSNAYLNYLISLKNLILKIAAILFFISFSVFAQTEEPGDSVFVMEKSPWGAVLRSAVFPGWGQIYTNNYWKAPVIWAAGGILIYNWKRNNDLYYDYRRYYAQGLVTKRQRDEFRDQRDLFAVYTILAYMLNLVDAYVNAQLFDFDVSSGENSSQLNMKFYF